VSLSSDIRLKRRWTCLKKKIKIWMLIYTIIFFVLTAIFVLDDIRNAYHVLYITCSIIIYLLANLGNMFYSLSYSSNTIQKYWRIIAPVIVLHFVSTGIIDSSQGAKEVSTILSIIIWIIGFITFFPTFRVNFILGYKKNT